jgi:hypothetical protein
VAATPNCTNGELTGYAAGPGYDLATGLGSIDANVLVTNWNSRSNGTATTTTFTPSATSFAHGTAVTLKTSVAGSGGTPTGDVAVMTDSPLITNQGQVVLTLASGAATASLGSLPGGSYNVWGNYSGDGTFAPSASSKTPITVTPEASTLELQVSEYANGQTASLAGQQVSYGTPAILNGYPIPTSEATCTSNCPYFSSPTGTVTFTDNGNALNTVVLNSEGDSEYTTGTLAVGAHSIAASYSGDSSYNKSTSTPGTVAFTVVKGATQVSVSTALATIAQGQTTTLTALVRTDGGGVAPTGSVTFLAGSTTLGTGTLSAFENSYAVATYTITSAQSTALPAGAVSLTGTYPGDSNYSSGTSTTPASLTVAAPTTLLPTTTTATASSSTASPTARINLSITVTGKTGSAAPSGTVDVQSGGVDLTPGGIALTAVTSTDTSKATYFFDNTSASLPQGNNSVVITYSGDTAYAPSQFGLSLTNPLTDFSMVTQNPAVTVAAGATGTATLNLGSINGFNAAVALACTAPTGMSCTLNPTSVTVNGNTTATLTINASTPASSVKSPGPSARRTEWLAARGGAVLAGVFLLGLPARRRRWRSMLGLVCFAILAAGIGCGGGGGSSSTPPPTTPTPPPTSGATPTPAGNYTIVVTGTQGSTLTHAIAVAVIVTASS